MAEISPFSAYRYDPRRVSLADVVTQPYDKITSVMQERYGRASPYNLIAVEKGVAKPGDSPQDNVYTRAERALQEWIRAGILVRDATPGIYVYFQVYTVPGSGERLTRKGFIALGRVEDYAAGVIFRHEQTLAGPKADRLELLRHTRTHTGQLFMLYADAERRVDDLLDRASKAAAPLEATDEYDVTHKLWPVFDAPWIAAVARAMAAQKLVIADGHHRYETALAYRNERRAGDARTDAQAPYEFAMMTFFNTRDAGLTILPTHRILAGVASFDAQSFRGKMSAAFEEESYSFGSDVARGVAFDRFRTRLASSPHSIGMYAPGVFTILKLRADADRALLLPEVPVSQRGLDVVLLHRLLLERGLGITAAAVTAEKNLSYERDIGTAVAAVDGGRAQAAFLLNPIGVEQVMEIALRGEVLPQKSTDFYPKLLSGLTLYRFD